MQFPGKKWLFIIGLVILIGLVLLAGIMLPKGNSVSNLYIIPAGVFSPSAGLASSNPSPPQTTTTPTWITTSATPAVSHAARGPTVVPVTAGNNPFSMPAARSSMNVLRGVPFIINGKVDTLSITKVQVWLLNGTISTTIIPVTQNGTFQVTLDSRETAALSRSFTTAVLVQYPSPPDHFLVIRNATTGDIIETESGQTTRILTHVGDPGSYPTTQVDYLEQGITAAGNPVRIYFLNGVDGWITIYPTGPVQPGTLVVSGNTSLPVGTSLSISVATANMHPTPKEYDWSHEIADAGTAMVNHGPGSINMYSGVIDTSKLEYRKISHPCRIAG